jgi:hypothetical protein
MIPVHDLTTDQHYILYQCMNSQSHNSPTLQNALMNPVHNLKTVQHYILY